MEATGLVSEPVLPTALAVPPPVVVPAPDSVSGSAGVTLGPDPPPEPQAAKLRARMHPNNPRRSLDEEGCFFMTLACAVRKV